MWRDAIGGPQLIARRGDVAPLTAEVFSSIGAPSLNGSGHAAFSGSLVGGGSGIWKETASGFELVMRDGDPAPGLGANFSGQSSLRIGFNDAGQTAFVAQVPVPSGQTLWKENAVGDLELVARQGDQAPGAALGQKFGNVGLANFVPKISADGRVAFQADLTGAGVTTSNRRGIWREDGLGGLDLIARRGDQAPGLPAGVVFQSPSTNVFEHITLNPDGDIAFIADYQGPGVFSTQTGLWAKDPDGNLVPIITTEQDIEVAPGDFRGITQLAFLNGISVVSGGQDGFRTGYNAAHQLAFKANNLSPFGSFQGVFRSSFESDAIPEPTTIALFALGLAGLGLAARRRRRS